MFQNKKGFTKMSDTSGDDSVPLNNGMPNSSTTTTTTTNTNSNTTTTDKKCSLSEAEVIGNEFYESGDIILRQGDVIDKILRISKIDDTNENNDNQTECILMTRTWSDGTTEEIGRLSAGDHIGLLFYSGFGFMVEDSLVTYTCVKDHVKCDVVTVDLKNGECVEIMKREMFKVVPGFCLLPYEVLDKIIGDSEVCKFYTASNTQIITKDGDSNHCYILLSGIVRPGSRNPSVYRDKEVLEIFGEAKFRYKSAKRTGDMYAIGETKCLEINIENLQKVIPNYYFETIETALRYRGNIMDFQKNNKSMYIDYETLARPFNVDSVAPATTTNLKKV